MDYENGHRSSLSPAQLRRNQKAGQASARVRRGRLIELYGEHLGETLFRDQMGQKRKGKPGKRSPIGRRAPAHSVSPPTGILAVKLAEARAASVGRKTRGLA